MSLSSALQIGRSALLTSQTALELTGNNLANAATPGYHRNTLSLAAVQTQQVAQGIFVGRGVQIDAITRQTSEALEARIRGSVSDGSYSKTRVDLLKQIENIEGEYTDVNLTKKMGAFFDAWSTLATKPQDHAARTTVLTESKTMIQYVNQIDGEVKALRQQTDDALKESIVNTNDLLAGIEQLNHQITIHEQGTGNGASSLRDQRDQLLSQLSQYMDISTVEMPSGSVDVYVGSIPVVMNGKAQNIEMKFVDKNGVSTPVITAGEDKDILNIKGGQIGAMIEYRTNDLEKTIQTLNDISSQIIWEVNKIHTQGQALDGFNSTTGTYVVHDFDAPLNSQAAGLPFKPEHGSFKIHVNDKTTGQMKEHTINVDLDGIGGDDTSMNDLVSQISAIDGVSASITPDGKLKIDSDASNIEFSFSDDSSFTLAALGINTFFEGKNAFNIKINQTLASDTSLIAASLNHLPGDGSNASTIEALRTKSLETNGGLSLTEYWTKHVQNLSVEIASANAQSTADQTVTQSLFAQQQQISGVNTDEEAINLMNYQQAYSAAARYLNVINEMMDSLMSLA